ncbi:tRNA-splicing endonuclease subunit sen54 [Elasticomyces elasticus]|nr:tRNA-splicing endonuclease subunit sen54 [Elasticomyces elasticus]
MADVDEDIIPPSMPGADDIDLSDETQDFRFLANLSISDPSAAKIPKRGEKDFEPHATALQSSTLDASRQAMHSALSVSRTHNPKAHLYGTYHPGTNMAYVDNPKGVHFRTMGQSIPPKDDPLGIDAKNISRLWLLPEEVLYLLERGTLDVRWPADAHDGTEVLGLPMSLQGAYAALLGTEGERANALTFERWIVYSGLKRSGYTVVHAPSWDGPGEPPGDDSLPPLQTRGIFLDLWMKAFAWNSTRSEARQKAGPLVPPKKYRSYADVYRNLALVPRHDPTQRRSISPTGPDPKFRITYHVYKPTSAFKKSAHGPPDFRIAVVNARETSMPTLDQLSRLLDTTPYNPPVETAMLYAKLRNGHKSVVLAVVDQGVVSYLRLSDAGFGQEKLYERRPPRGTGGKRGGKGGGRGRGRR